MTIELTPEMIARTAAGGNGEASPFSSGKIRKCTGALLGRGARVPDPGDPAAGSRRWRRASRAAWARGMRTRRGRRAKRIFRRRNPVARTLRDPAFRARREANRRSYSRKLKHRREAERDDG